MASFNLQYKNILKMNISSTVLVSFAVITPSFDLGAKTGMRVHQYKQ
ncbi:hypothetical protein [Flavobacterium sp. J27]|nr:hypothetical protein [Flavobacterium sp. J27]